MGKKINKIKGWLNPFSSKKPAPEQKPGVPVAVVAEADGVADNVVVVEDAVVANNVAVPNPVENAVAAAGSEVVAVKPAKGVRRQNGKLVIPADRVSDMEGYS